MKQPDSTKRVLISGASIAGMTTALSFCRIGYSVTVVEMAGAPRTAGAAVDIRDNAIESVKELGLFDQLKRHRLTVEKLEFKNAADETEAGLVMNAPGTEQQGNEIEIERDKFLEVIMTALHNRVDFIFNDSITGLEESDQDITAVFRSGLRRSFDLVIGCDGTHSAVRRICFGAETEFSHFMGAYFALSISPGLLIPERTMQLFNVPGKAITLNAYNGKTDIIFCFLADEEIGYDYRDTTQQRAIVTSQFDHLPWRATELLAKAEESGNFYFDKFCQIKMPLWTKGRVALVGDAGYCASPAAGMGASLSITGAYTLASSLQKSNGDHARAFEMYNRELRPFIEEVQETATRNVRDNFIPRTEEAIRVRNSQAISF